MSFDFVPSQAITKDVDLYAEITSNSTLDVFSKVLDSQALARPGIRIHDNGCGAGEVTSVIMSSPHSPDIFIEATDIDESYLQRLRGHALQNKWPVNVTAMKAEDLTFASESFDISVANFLLFMTQDDGVTALRHMHRTLKEGGAAIFTSWAHLPHSETVKAAHLATRGVDAPPLREYPPQWQLGSHMGNIAALSGFENEKIEQKSVKVYINVEDTERLAQVMWSFLGRPASGWLESDEENWDRAIETIRKSFLEDKGYTMSESGQLKIELVANAIIARK
ncbi:S-adenosyl-L-methionine-dependent methyltransferase [Daldinia loculata]|uniref:S-adenosyl-L-methionine-dependent methyltransferase n=1 Tax=Daldinia loculata TaxID=103429 RepID=UPI0020C2F4DC|nr:S-adenosyl-L-methionine-dependent methyltransferase [Daldinia loculata]KAI1647336.1 S-adenosyl-L-methionine-dependent methyltransferase [Daldinia loculata]